MSKKKPESKAAPAPARARPVARKPTRSAGGQAATVNDWQAVWMRAVALAWKEPEFEAALQKDPRQALKKRFDFDLPASIQLKVVPSTAKDAAADSTWKVNSAEVELHLPKKPADVADHAVALSSLTDTYGRSHCCGSPCC
ncbi:BMA_0021/BMA_0022 family TOMM bacteriocin [Corallococcus exercitus]|uniref:BMA_0021/BMA_0022 family TOMM bacteriocin n=1 Tax=Corallococcus exercitus TaxID=2316736 RepID=UPI0035D46B32